MLHVRERPAADVVDPPQHEIGVVEPPGSLRARKKQEKAAQVKMSFKFSTKA
jgi:hypothetical protein